MESTNSTVQDRRWLTVLARDASARDDFVIGVKTTGIYCRPGCPARTPKRGNVLFFETCEQARAGGFRSCKRCKPDETADSPGQDGHFTAR